MTQALLRFVLGGMIVAVLPFVADRAGPGIAGLVILFPATSFAGLLFLGQTQGLHRVEATAAGAIIGLPTVLAFLSAAALSARRGLALPWVLTLATACWFLVAGPLAIFDRRRSRQ